MYDIMIYPITPNLWRWEIRCDGVLFRCGVARSKIKAAREAKEVVGV